MRETSFELDSDGYLKEDSGLARLLEDTCPEVFRRAHALNRDCHDLIFRAEVRNRDPQRLLVSTLFVKALEHYQAVVLLAQNGLISSIKVALRALIETTFAVRAVGRSEETVQAFIKDDLLQQRKKIRKAQANDYPELGPLKESLSPEVIAELDEEIADLDAKHLTTEKLSQLAGLHDWYITQYTILCGPTHSHVRSLEAYLVIGPTGEVDSLNYSPELSQVSELLLTACHSLLLSAAAVVDVFDLDFQQTGDAHMDFITSEFEKLSCPPAAGGADAD